MSEDCHDSNNLYRCEYCGEDGHLIADCPDLATWNERQRARDMALEAAYYSDPRWKEILGE